MNNPVDAPVFIGGYFKSGTSLLRALLGQHPRIASGLETHWFAIDPRAGTGRGGEPIGETAARIATFFHLDPEAVDAAAHRAASGEDFLCALMAMHARAQGKPRWAEKTPDNLLHVDRVFAHWPEARFVHIVRDPRDVYLSLRNCGKAGDEDAFATAWASWIEAGEAAGERAGLGRFLTIVYEDLVVEPEPVMRRVVDLLGEDWDPAVARFDGKADEYDLVLKATGKKSTTLESLSRPLFADRVGLWREALPAAAIARLDAALTRAGAMGAWNRLSAGAIPAAAE